jgi:hypothetical protein
VLGVQEQGPDPLNNGIIFFVGMICIDLNDCSLGLSRTWGKVFRKQFELNKLYEYIDPQVTIDEIYWRIMDNIKSLDKIVEHSRSVVGEPLPPLSEYWVWDEERIS